MDFNILQLALTFLTTGDHPACALLIFFCASLLFALNWVWGQYRNLTTEHNALRDEANKQTIELNSALKELQESYAQANNNTADMLKKISDTIYNITQLLHK